MSDLNTVAFFHPIPAEDVGNDTILGKVKIVYGTLPLTSAEHAVLTLHGPIEMVVPGKYKPTERSPPPVYDERNNQVVWAVKCLDLNDPNQNVMSKTSLLRIGKHFNLDGGELVPTRWKKLGNPRVTSVITQAGTGLASVGMVGHVEDGSLDIIIAQKHDATNQAADKMWSMIPFEVPREGDQKGLSNNDGVLLSSHHDSNKTVYHLSFPLHPALKGYIFLDTMPSSVFSQLHKDSSLLWRRTKVKTRRDLNESQDLCPLLTHDQAGTTSWLWLFQITHERIVVEYVKLRADGTVPGDNDVIDVPILSDLDGKNCNSLCVVSSGNNVLMTWRQNSKVMGRMAELKPDGMLPLPLSTWKPVEIKFDNPPKVKLSNCGVLVPNDFVG